MIVLTTRAYESLKAVLGRRQCDEGPPDHVDAAPPRQLVALAELVGDFAKASAGTPNQEQKQHVRACLLEIAAVSLRGVEAIDTYDLAHYWKEQDAAARA